MKIVASQNASAAQMNLSMHHLPQACSTDVAPRRPFWTRGAGRLRSRSRRRSRVRGMRVVPAVLRCAFVRERPCCNRCRWRSRHRSRLPRDEQRRIAQVANEGGDRDVDNVVAEAASIGPAAGNQSAIAERILDLALEHIAAEDAQAREARVVRILGSLGPLPAKRARGVERSTLIKSGMKMPEMSVR